jgi:hypothetical protein
MAAAKKPRTGGKKPSAPKAVYRLGITGKLKLKDIRRAVLAVKKASEEAKRQNAS